MSDVTIVAIEEEVIVAVVESQVVPITVNEGVPGADGADGTNGTNGADGEDGVGVPAGGDAGQLLAKIDGDDFNTEWVDPPVTVGTASKAAYFDASGNLASRDRHSINALGFDQIDYIGEPDDLSQSNDFIRHDYYIEPLQDSPNESFLARSYNVNIDPDSSGFDFGTAGTGWRFEINNVYHHGTSDIGSIEFIQNNFDIGNGTDPLDVRGISYMYGFGTVRSGVTITQFMQGYGFSPTMEAGSTLDPSVYITAFYDNANIHTDCFGYTSFNGSPNIDVLKATHNFNGFSSFPGIPVVEHNAGVIGMAIGGTIGTMGDQSYWQGVNVNPNITSGRSVTGLNVSMDNVTPYAGVAASLVIQDLTIAVDIPTADGNAATIEFRDDGTAGAETITQGGQLVFVVHMEDGVSTAQNIADALNGFIGFTSNFNVTISGTASNPQVAQAATNLSGGENPGRVLAAWLDGDVEITGSLAFQGALSIGNLSAFASKELVDTGGNPQSIHGLVSNPTVAANTTLTTGDVLGINTAMLLTIGDNGHLNTGFVGAAALGLPAVVSMGTGATADQISGALFAVSLDGGAAGGTIDRLDLCRSVAIPNGVTAITNLRGYKFDLPFGDPGTTSWGFYEAPGVHNYFAGDLLIGGTPGSDDTVSNASVALEIKSDTKALVLSRMATAQRDALTAINGMVIYNTTDEKFQGYENGAWANLI